MATPNVADYFIKVGNPGTATTLSAPGYTAGVSTTINVGSTANMPNDDYFIFAIDTATVVNGVQVRTANSYCVFVGLVASSTSISGIALLYGTPQNYAAGALTRVYIPISSVHTNRLIDGLRIAHNNDGSLIPAAVRTALGIGSTSTDWNILNAAVGPNTVTANGNRSYNLVFNGVNLTSVVNPGTRLRTTRTVLAPTQCTSLNGTTQFYSKTSPAGMTFTNFPVHGWWIKLASYNGAVQTIASRYNGTSGHTFTVNASGQLVLTGFNAAAANFNSVTSYQSVPLNKWVHVAAELDMSTATLDGTHSWIMIDGVDVPAFKTSGGTAPTALIQAGNLEIGSQNAGLLPFNGKIANGGIFSAAVTETTMRGYMSQSLAGTETSLISAYSFNGVITDLNTTNANNLTANGSAVATNADSPFGGQADSTISSTLDYAIVQKATFSTNTTITVQVPEGCTIPTSGGVASVVYSSNKAPYGMPVQKDKWRVSYVYRQQTPVAVSAAFAAFLGIQLVVPVGAWEPGWQAGLYAADTNGYYFTFSPTSQTGLTSTTSDLTLQERVQSSAAVVLTFGVYLKTAITLASASTYQLYSLAPTTNAGILGTTTTCEFFAENAYL